MATTISRIRQTDVTAWNATDPAAAQYVMIDERLRFSISSNIAMVNSRL
jgi:hypothetical protein